MTSKPGPDDIDLGHGVFVRRNDYPNGQESYAIHMSYDLIGSVDKVEGGYAPYGARKPSPTLLEAVRRKLLSEAKSAQARHDKLMKAAEEMK